MKKKINTISEIIKIIIIIITIKQIRIYTLRVKEKKKIF